MISNYSYFLDKTIQTLFLTAALSIMIQNGWSSILSIFLTVLFSLIILDGLQGKTGYVYMVPSNQLLNVQYQQQLQQQQLQDARQQQQLQLQQQQQTAANNNYPLQQQAKDAINSTKSTVSNVAKNVGHQTQATIDSLAKEIQEFRNQLNADKPKQAHVQLTGGSYYPRL